MGFLGPTTPKGWKEACKYGVRLPRYTTIDANNNPEAPNQTKTTHRSAREQSEQKSKNKKPNNNASSRLKKPSVWSFLGLVVAAEESEEEEEEEEEAEGGRCANTNDTITPTSTAS